MEQEFHLKDLKTGYVVVLNNGRRYLVLKRKDFYEEHSNFLGMSDGNVVSFMSSRRHFDEDLNGVGVYEGQSIEQVYGCTFEPGNAYSISIDCRELIWERKRTRKMTVAEISKALGYEVEIVKGDT